MKQLSTKILDLNKSEVGKEKLARAKELVTRRAEEAKVDPLDRLFSGPLMEKNHDIDQILQIYRSFETQTGGSQPGQSWCDELAHLVIQRRGVPQKNPRHEELARIISNGLRDSKDCFDFLTSLDQSFAYKITCKEKGTKIRNSSPIQFNSIEDLKQKMVIGVDDLRFHIEFMGDEVISFAGRVAVSQLATKYILVRTHRKSQGTAI